MKDKTKRRGEIPSINNLTGVVVSWNEPDALVKAVNSIRKYYPKLPLIIIDGCSDGESLCQNYIDSLDNVQKISLDWNISHGRGLHLGITISPTNYVLCFDSDIEMVEPCIEKMLRLMKNDTLMVGKIIALEAQKTLNIDIGKESVLYIRPHFHIINRREYRKYYPYVHSAAPGQILLPQITTLDREDKLEHFDLDKYVKHYQGKTSQRFGNKKSGSSHRNDWVLQTWFFKQYKNIKGRPLCSKDEITGVVVVHNTWDLLKRAIDSIWQFYPEMNIIVVDGSTPPLPEVKNWKDDRIKKIQLDWNIGHGRGMDIGINCSPTRRVCVFDSDIIMKKPCIEKMMGMFEDDTVAVGWVLPVKQQTYEININNGKDIPVIAPFFHIIDRHNYWKHLPYIQSGGPTCLTSIDIYNKGLSGKAFKNIFIKEYVRHDGQGTVGLFDMNDLKDFELFPDDVRPSDYFKKCKRREAVKTNELRVYDFKNDVKLKFKTEEEVFEFFAENYL